MFHWSIIFIGIIVLSFSISNPFYAITFKKILNFNLLTDIFIRILLFLLGLMIILTGLYVESIY
jgi:hypothetical protein